MRKLIDKFDNDGLAIILFLVVTVYMVFAERFSQL